MPEVNILAIQRVSAADRAQIEAVDPGVRLTDAGGWYDGEIREQWPPAIAERWLPLNAVGAGTRAERDAFLATAEVVLSGWPYPKDLRARAPKLKWLHQRPAGASNLLHSDLWGSDVTVTTSRGTASPLPIAEHVVATILHFAKGLHRAAVDREKAVFDFRAYKPILVEGKTVLVVGAGGIGLECGRLCAGLGMRVIGTRRTRPTGPLPPGFSAIGGADDLDTFLPESDAVVIACHWTPETTNLFDARRFGLMKPGSVIVNIARGDIIDESALIETLARDHLRGAALDVYVGEFDRPPPEALWRDPRVLITPHTSGMSDVDKHGAVGLFCRNLRAYLDGKPLENVIDWARGY